MGGLFEQYAPPGQMVQVNSHRLHIQCGGNNGPTVIFESGQAGFSLDWVLVQPEVNRFARTCSYDRAGLGWSESGSSPRTPVQIVAELHAMLTAANISRPYVLVAHSLGVRYVRLYARQYPGEVAGMVLVDGYHEAFDTLLGEAKLRVFIQNRAKQYRFLDFLARLGVFHLFGRQIIGMLGPDYRAIPMQERKRYALIATRPGAMATTIDEYEQAIASNDNSQAQSFRKDLPLRILTHGVPWRYPDYERSWQDSQNQAVLWSSSSRLIVAEKSGHAIMLAQPELVVDAIRDIVEETMMK